MDNSVSLVPDTKQYNEEDFPKSYSDAKFFVIKSYSEDDVLKSIKYNVWVSTSTGNKKLDAAFREAKEKPGGCPVFLLFSVNSCGQFVRLAEMVGPVDFNETLEYWRQDKWTGCFPVKWHIDSRTMRTSLKKCILDDFELYETRQKTIQERKAKKQLLRKQVPIGEPNDGVVTDSKESTATASSTAGTVKANGEVKPLEENG
ncbi:hypothetical protein PTKIN_Ptkin01aG0331500 [Pterospermum kingtungense]